MLEIVDFAVAHPFIDTFIIKGQLKKSPKLWLPKLFAVFI